jgi:tRNA pseudouridine55 synthase
MYSALKHEGRALVRVRPRRCIEIERAAHPGRSPFIRIDIVDWQNDVLGVGCAVVPKARTFARSPKRLERRLGCGAHLQGFASHGEVAAWLWRAAVTLGRLCTAMSRTRTRYPSAARRCAVVRLARSGPGREPEAAPFFDWFAPPRERVWLICHKSGSTDPTPRRPLANCRIAVCCWAVPTSKAGELIPTRLLSPAEVQGMLTECKPFRCERHPAPVF